MVIGGNTVYPPDDTNPNAQTITLVPGYIFYDYAYAIENPAYYEMDTDLSSPSNGGSSTASDTLYAPYAISMVGSSSAGDVFNGFTVSQPTSVLFLTFYTSSLAEISTVDLSTVPSSVTAPATTAFFVVSAASAVQGQSYNASFSLNGQSISYSVIPHSLQFETDFSAANSSPNPGINVWPLGPAMPGYIVNFPYAPTGNLNLVFYDSGLTVLQTNAIAMGSFTAPPGTALWSVEPGALISGSNAVAEYTISQPNSGKATLVYDMEAKGWSVDTYTPHGKLSFMGYREREPNPARLHRRNGAPVR